VAAAATAKTASAPSSQARILRPVRIMGKRVHAILPDRRESFQSEFFPENAFD
jgi:hypothetical protein